MRRVWGDSGSSRPGRLESSRCGTRPHPRFFAALRMTRNVGGAPGDLHGSRVGLSISRSRPAAPGGRVHGRVLPGADSGHHSRRRDSSTVLQGAVDEGVGATAGLRARGQRRRHAPVVPRRRRVAEVPGHRATGAGGARGSRRAFGPGSQSRCTSLCPS